MNDPTGTAAHSNLVVGIQFIRWRWGLLLAISVLVLLPVFWHQRIEAGDLASHTYNAWLAHLAGRGEAPGLYVVPQWTNILVDISLVQLRGVFGFAIAERVVVSACVLIFFWGAFALIASSTRRPAWFLLPAVAMITHGWTFQMGFLNYYLSVGIGFLAVALLWRGRDLDWLGGFLLLTLSLVAHPAGFLAMASIAVYLTLANRSRSWQRWVLLTVALLTVFAVHLFIIRHYQTRFWQSTTFYLMNGSDQLILYGRRYAKLAVAAVLWASAALLYDRRRERDVRPPWRFRTPFEVWAILVFGAAMIPEWVQVPHYAAPVAFSASRLTSITAVMALCVLGHMRPRIWHLAGCSVIAAIFFAWMYRDTGVLDRMEAQSESLVATLPPGRRVVKTIWPPPDSRIYFIHHMVDRACIGHCFSYANYEPASQQFRIRVRLASPIVVASPESAGAMDRGQYVVRPEDLPMTEIYQCDGKDLTRLCIRDLSAGEENGRIGYPPPAVQ